MDRIEWQTSCFFATAALHVVGRLHIAQPVSNSFLTEKKVAQGGDNDGGQVQEVLREGGGLRDIPSAGAIIG